MNFYQAAFIIDAIALIAIYLMPANKTPSYGIPPDRIGGIFVSKHLVITIVTGAMIGLMSDVESRWLGILYGIIFQFIVGQIVHILFGTKTMLLYKLGLSEMPDGTGRLASPVLQQKKAKKVP